MMQRDLTGKVALITGGANGIGAGIARRFSKAGAAIVIADLDDKAGHRTAEEVNGCFTHLDVTDFAANRAAVDLARTKFGQLDIAVCNAGISNGLALDESFDPLAYRRLMAINLDGVVYGMAAAFAEMKANGGGDIIVTASMAGIAPTPFEPLYAASKTALVGLVRSFGLASVAHGVRVNAVCPAFADTALIADIAGGLTAAGVPLLTVEEVVNAYELILASEQSAQCWFVQPGRAIEPFAFRGAPGPRRLDGSSAAAADPEVQLTIERERLSE